MSPLPADGLLDGSLLQVDVVVEGGGALVIIRLQTERGCAVAWLRMGAPAAGRWHGHPHAAPPQPGYPPSGPGHCVPPSSSSAAGGCRCRTSCSAGCTRGCPARACCGDTNSTLSPAPSHVTPQNPTQDAPSQRPGAQAALAGAWPRPPRLQTDVCGTGLLALGNLKNKLLFSLLPLRPPKSRAQPSQRDGAGSGHRGARHA